MKLLKVVSALGVFEDSWLKTESYFEFLSDTSLHLALYVPLRDGQSTSKIIRVRLNDAKIDFTITRGEICTIGPFEPTDGLVSLSLSCAEAEPTGTADLRVLGVRLVSVQSLDDGGLIEAHDVSAFANDVALTVQSQSSPIQDSSPFVDKSSPSGSIEQTEPAFRPSASDHPEAWAIAQHFDFEFYLAGFSAGSGPPDPLDHYLTVGWKEGRDPTPWFSTWHYLATHEDVANAGLNPFFHYCISGVNEGRHLARLGTRPTGNSVFRAHEFAVSAGPHFEEFDPSIGVGKSKRVKLLAYYLPQFHPIEENDRNWGKGFTEWRNLPRGMPRFMGHVQPRIPRDLGCYSLSEGDAMRRQIGLAQAAGIYGFCFYYYWFDGKRVLETPTERLLADPTLDMPFCLMWANENWSRTWDGADSEIILQQSYRPEDDKLFVADLARHMQDKRYIEIDGRPLFFIYRPGHIPNTRDFIERIRSMFKENHSLDPLIFQAQAFGDEDPRLLGTDGAIEFPPHKILNHAPDVSANYEIFDQSYTGNIREYSKIVDVALSSRAANFPLIRTSFPSWDNDARRPGRGTTIANSTPGDFSRWLNWTLDQAEQYPVFGESFACVNAWNEWAEGAYLEPDVHFGAAYLNAVSRAVHRDSDPGHLTYSKKVLLVGHDILAFGAQQLLANIAASLKSDFGCEISFLLMDNTRWDDSYPTILETYQGLGEVHFAPDSPENLQQLCRHLRNAGYGFAIANTTVSGSALPVLKYLGFRTVSLIHELPSILHNYNLDRQAREIASKSDVVIFPAEVVKRGFEAFAGDVQNTVEIFPQGLYNKSILVQELGDNGLRAELALPPNCRIVLGAGYADMRKGIDRFVASAISVCGADETAVFLWAGIPGPEYGQWLAPEIANAGFNDRIKILGHRKDMARFFAAADLYYMSSREDPFPSVVLEALACGLPVVGHQGCGGCDQLIERFGVLLPSSNPQAASDAILDLLNRTGEKAQADSDARRLEIRENYRFEDYVFGLLQRLNPSMARVSVVVPNYNYEAFIGQRLQTVFDQSYPLQEVIVLDDASPDRSLDVIKATATAAGRSISLHVNEKNSGSPFPQWLKGAAMASGDYVWIAEADDLAAPEFVERLITAMQASGAAIGFCDSRTIDENDIALGDSYRPYMNEFEPGAFDRPFVMEGREFLSRFLAVKNVMLNVSGVVFRKEALVAAFEAVGKELFDYNVAGDWRLYVEICAHGGRVAYVPDALNTHRRHKISVTHALKMDKHLAEIDTMHQLARSLASLGEEKIEQQRSHLRQCISHLLS